MREIGQAVATLRGAVATLDAAGLSPDEAERLVDLLSEGERICQAGRAIAAHRVVQSRAWRVSGFRTPAAWLAARTQSSLSQAITRVETAHRLAALPTTREAFVSGRISEIQATHIAAAAEADADAEETLLDMAARETVGTLRERCREVRAAASSEEDLLERIRAGRFLRHWTDRDGAVRLDARLAPDDGARLIAAVTARAARLQDDASRSGHREPAEAYSADALVGLIEGKLRPKAVVHVHVDRAALERGHTVPGETCRIEGIGPVPVEAAWRLATDGVVKALATEDADVHAVAHIGRTIPARVRTALEARDRTCVVPGCEIRTNLEIDHIVPLADGGPTTLDNLARLCRYHHGQKSRRRWRLEGAPGSWVWTRGGRRTTVGPGRSPPARGP